MNDFQASPERGAVRGRWETYSSWSFDGASRINHVRDSSTSSVRHRQCGMCVLSTRQRVRTDSPVGVLGDFDAQIRLHKPLAVGWDDAVVGRGKVIPRREGGATHGQGRMLRQSEQQRCAWLTRAGGWRRAVRERERVGVSDWGV